MPSPETKFLVASGERPERDLLTAVLADMGYLHSTCVDNGRDAKAVIASGVRCFILAAWELPGLGGLRLAREVRDNAGSAGQVVVLIVPEHNDSERSLAEGVGVTDFLPRPLAHQTVRKRLERIIESRKESRWPEIMEARGDRLAEAGRTEEALAEYEGALRTGRERLAGLHTEMGLVLRNQGRLDEAVGHLEKAAIMDPGSTRAQKALGEAYLDAGRAAEASRALERANRLDPQNTAVRTQLAESLLRSGDLFRAEVIFQDLFDRTPEDTLLLNRLAIALRKQGKFEKAVANYLKALKLNKRDENLYFNLGRSYFEVGRLDKAQIAVKRALALNPELKGARQLLTRINKANG